MSTPFAAQSSIWLAPGSQAPTGIRSSPARPVFARFVAVVAAVLGIGHVWVMTAFPHGMLMNMVLGLMVLACLRCAYHAWKRPAALVELLAMSAFMAIIHTFMALGAHGGHDHGGDAVEMAATAGDAVMLLVAAAELALVLLCGIGLRLAAPRAGNPSARNRFGPA